MERRIHSPTGSARSAPFTPFGRLSGQPQRFAGGPLVPEEANESVTDVPVPQERTKEHPGEIVIGETVTAWIAGKIRTEPGVVIRVGDSIDVTYSIAHLSALKSDSSPD